MPKYSKEKESEHREYVRVLLVMNPNITIIEAQKALESSKNVRLDKDYVHKLLKSIQQEKAEKENLHTKTQVFSHFKDEEELAKKLLWEIIRNPKSKEGDKINALREIRTWSLTIIDKMTAANVFLPEKFGYVLVKEPDYSNFTPEDFAKREKELDEEIASLERQINGLRKE